MPDLPQVTPEMIAAYWRLKEAMKTPGPVGRVPVEDFAKALAEIIGDKDWPDWYVFDRLFIEPENSALKPDA